MRTALVLLATLAATVALAGPASAAKQTQCGAIGPFYKGSQLHVINALMTNGTCTTARGVALAWHKLSWGTHTVRGYRCVPQGTKQLAAVKCTHGGRWLSFQHFGS